MKVEMEDFDMLRYIRNRIEGKRREREKINNDYVSAYKRCFEGTPEEMERRLAAWDYVHEVTRLRRSY